MKQKSKNNMRIKQLVNACDNDKCQSDRASVKLPLMLSVAEQKLNYQNLSMTRSVQCTSIRLGVIWS